MWFRILSEKVIRRKLKAIPKTWEKKPPRHIIMDESRQMTMDEIKGFKEGLRWSLGDRYWWETEAEEWDH